MLLQLAILLSALFCCLCGLAHYKQLTISLYLILCQVSLGYLAETIGFAVTMTRGNNAGVFNVYLIMDIWLIGLAGTYMLQKKFRIAAIILILLVSIVWVFDFIHSGTASFCNRTLVCESSAFTVLYLFAIWREYQSFQGDIIKNPHWWLCIGILLFYCCIIPYFGFLNALIKAENPLAVKLYPIIHVFDIAKYLIISYSFILCRGNQKAGTAYAHQ